ncbi:MAG: asparagine synthase (glutamine-hydrolyzing) [Ginsengibacter sp.]
MCGIAGKINFDPDHKIDEFELKSMTDSLYDRGPDDEGFYLNKNIGLGFRRLSIIDLSTGHQPLSNEDGSIWIVFNGEIYNYQELQEKLIQQGHIFKTKSDTETIVHLYEQHGFDCLKYLRGMFSFAIWDNNLKQLFCARDRFGIKPFYYYFDKEKFVFGSEIKTLLKSRGIDKSLSYEALDSYFAFGYISNDLSIYKNIKKLNPAHYLVLSLDKKSNVSIERYWDIIFEPDYSKTEEDWCREIETCFSETVKLHMISEVPLGAFLSGGIDSSSVVAMMAKNSNRPIKTFSIGFKEQTYNELKYAREIANKYGTEHHEQIVEPESMSLLPKLVKAYDEPFADSSAIPTYYVSKLAREFVTVALSGDGGDELFAGYDNYNKLNKIKTSSFHSSNPFVNKMIWGNLYKLIPQSVSGKGLSYLLSHDKKYIGAYASFWPLDERKKLLMEHSKIDYQKASEGYKENILKEGEKNDFISNLQFLDMRSYMVDDILTKVDRASMMNSLEVRVPFLDHKFAELTFRIPSSMKLHKNSQKYIFKKSMESFLPPNIFNHEKQGFGIPLSYWFKDDLKEYVNDTLLSESSFSTKYLSKKIIKKTIADNNKGMRNLSSKIWSLIFFEEWLKQNQDL